MKNCSQTNLYRYSLLILLLAYSLSSLSQSIKADSLKLRLDQVETTESKISLLHQLAFETANLDPVSGIEYARKSLSLSEQLNDSALIAKSYNHIGLVYDFTGNYAYAEKYYTIAYDIIIRNDGKTAADGYLNNLGGVCFYTGRYEEAMDHYLASLRIREKKIDSTNERSLKDIAQSYNNIGLLLKHQGSYEGAITYYKKALSTKKFISDVSSLIASYSNLSVLYLELDSMEIAKKNLERALFLSDSIQNDADKAMVLSNMGLIYYRSKSWGKALSTHFQTLDIYESSGDQHGKATAFVNIASIYLETSQKEQGHVFAQKALSIGRKISSPNVILSSLKLLSKLSSPELSIKYLEEYITLKDSVSALEVQKKINQMVLMYETEKKDGEIELLKSKNVLIAKENQIAVIENVRKDSVIAKNQTLVISLIVLILLALILGFVLIRYYRAKKEHSEERAKNLYMQHQTELDKLYMTIRLQMEQLDAQKVEFNISPETFNRHLVKPLSPREIEVIYLVSEGYSNQEIGDKLFVSINTVKTHLLRIYEKLEVSNRTEAVMKAAYLTVHKKNPE